MKLSERPIDIQDTLAPNVQVGSETKIVRGLIDSR